MSRIGRRPIEIPSGVDVDVDGSRVRVKGPKGTLEQTMHPDMKITNADGTVTVERPDDEREHRALHGLTRSLVANMVEGVTSGFTKTLEIQGVGYRAALKGSNIELAVGFSHPVVIEPPAGVTFEVPQPTRIIVSGADKQAVGQIAANIRAIRKPDAYKGKGIRYQGEYVRKKAGKAGKT
ncbi:MAG: 50S ribosomal protein L6 [Actinobacteria bacterium]|nr:MAG: 50S ribosomal protein L6 [Actinomycetota bacterium]